MQTSTDSPTLSRRGGRKRLRDSGSCMYLPHGSQACPPTDRPRVAVEKLGSFRKSIGASGQRHLPDDRGTCRCAHRGCEPRWVKRLRLPRRPDMYGSLTSHLHSPTRRTAARHRLHRRGLPLSACRPAGVMFTRTTATGRRPARSAAGCEVWPVVPNRVNTAGAQ